MTRDAAIGRKLRKVRKAREMTQAELAGAAGISTSYLNLIENGRRSLSDNVLRGLEQALGPDVVQLLADGETAALEGDVLEVLGDPLVRGMTRPTGEAAEEVSVDEVRAVVGASPGLARALVSLYRAQKHNAATLRSLATQMAGQGGAGLALEGGDGLPEGANLPFEDVNDFRQAHLNHFPPLEQAAEALWHRAGLATGRRLDRLVQHALETLELRVEIEAASPVGPAEHDATGVTVLKRFDPDARVLHLSELLPIWARAFQVAHQVALLTLQAELDALTDDPNLGSSASRSLARITLANYFAAALLMRYDPFLRAAEAVRYDIELLARRFGVSFEQVCHRLTSLRRPGAEGVPFHLLRVDVAGNISKRFSATGMRFARFSGACPKSNVFNALQTPGMVRTQLSEMPDGRRYFSIARTLWQELGVYHGQRALQSLELGCEVQHATRLVYADGVDLRASVRAAKVGVTCRLCPRTDCAQRVLPSIHSRMDVDENVRGLTPYTTAGLAGGSLE